jgi:hypothetical protein
VCKREVIAQVSYKYELITDSSLKFMIIPRDIFSQFDPKICSVLGSVQVLLDVSEVQELLKLSNMWT